MDLVISPFPIWIDFSSRPSSIEKVNKSIYFFAVVVVVAGLVMGLNSITLFMLIDPFLLLGQPEPSRLGSAPGVNGALSAPFTAPRRAFRTDSSHVSRSEAGGAAGWMDWGGGVLSSFHPSLALHVCSNM